MSDLLPGDGWFAAIEPQANSGNGRSGQVHYAEVIAWERIDDNGPRLRAWITGVIPVASDQFYEVTAGWVLNHFQRLTPLQIEERSKTWARWNWS